jgi:excisionase family DNA binding protein
MNENTIDYTETIIDDLLKPQDISRKLKISRSFTYRLLQLGEIPSVRLGKTYRVRPMDLVAYIQKNLHSRQDGC